MQPIQTRTHRRLATVVLAPLAAIAAWAVIRAAGIELDVSGGSETVGAADVVVAASAGAIAAWAFVALLARHARRPRRAWALVATTALSASTAGPAWLADGVGAVALIALHFVVGIVVIAGFAGTLPVRSGVESAGARSATMSV
jgi:Family of unknown function (DUF6069)